MLSIILVFVVPLMKWVQKQSLKLPIGHVESQGRAFTYRHELIDAVATLLFVYQVCLLLVCQDLAGC